MRWENYYRMAGAMADQLTRGKTALRSRLQDIAADAIGNTFIVAQRKKWSLVDDKPVIYRCLRFEVIHALKRHSRWLPQDIIERGYKECDLIKMVDEATIRLKPELRHAARLKVAGHNRKEIANILGIREETTSRYAAKIKEEVRRYCGD